MNNWLQRKKGHKLGLEVQVLSRKRVEVQQLQLDEDHYLNFQKLLQMLVEILTSKSRLNCSKDIKNKQKCFRVKCSVGYNHF